MSHCMPFTAVVEVGCVYIVGAAVYCDTAGCSVGKVKEGIILHTIDIRLVALFMIAIVCSVLVKLPVAIAIDI